MLPSSCGVPIMSSSVIIFTLFLASYFNLQQAAPLDLLQKVAPYLPWTNKGEEIVTYRLFTRDHPYNEPEVTQRDVFNFTRFSPKRPTTVLIHGWKGYANCSFTFTVASAYHSAKDHNVIAVDWSGAGSKDYYYPSAQKKIREIAWHVAAFLESLHAKTGVKPKDIHIVGHSLGAHIAGIVGRLMDSGKIGRVTGIDPAGPLFSEKDTLSRLSQDSAEFVDVIHSSTHYIGFGGQLGHADFYPNGPRKLQPGCHADVLGICSHSRGYHYYVESLWKPNAFLAVPCADWESFQKKECDVSAVVPMGIATPPTARGIYYLETNKASPFGTGVIWTTY